MQDNNTKTITSYKGFDKDLRCRGFQFEISQTYSTMPIGDALALAAEMGIARGRRQGGRT